jgi:hypothetical protein
MRLHPSVIFRILLCAVLSTSVAHGKLPPEPANQGPLPLRVEKAEEDYIGSPRPQWGLAISGGGLRSALFTFGALKTLHDDGILGDMDIISTVSGGGYTAYEVYLNELASNSSQFGSATFGKSVFTQKIMELLRAGNFVTYPQMLRTIFSREKTIELYENSLQQTFGSAEGQQLTSLSSLAFPAKAKLPYLVVNTTFVRPTPTGFADGLFEMTPLLVGNARLGYRPWVRPITFRKAIAISGAAFKAFLKQNILNPAEKQPTRITLSDGGHSENLGAFALIRRGVRNVIIIDAEHDPVYTFGAYTNLKKRLVQWDSHLSICSIERILADKKSRRALAKGGRAPTALHTGTVKSIAKNGEEVTTVIYYLKMSLTDTVDKEVRADNRIARGRDINQKRMELLEKKNPSISELFHPVKKIDFAAWFAYQVVSYREFIDDYWKVKLMRVLSLNFAKINFPQYSTGDQSFYLDQSVAFIGLGYFAAKDLTKAIRSSERISSGR